MGAKGGYRDLTGMIFGDWKAIKFDDSKGKYKYYWICECVNCGNIKSIASASLLTENKSKRCEVCNKNFKLRSPDKIKGYEKDLTGNKYGKFTILKYSHSSHTHSHWVARCECGNIETHPIGFYTRDNSTKMCNTCRIKEQEIIAMKRNEKIQEEKNKLKKYKEENKEQFLVRRKFNDYQFKDDYVIINGRVLIDLDDFKKIDGENRYLAVNSGGYAYITKYNEEIFIHRLIMGLPNSYDEKTQLIVDHINGNKLDNRKSNLRIIKKEINPINCKTYKNNTSGVKGVSWMKRLNKWQSSIQINKNNIYLGVYSDFDEAVRVRKEAEVKYFGEYNRKEDQKSEVI